MKKKLAITLLLALLLSALLCAGALAARTCLVCGEESLSILTSTSSSCNFKCTNSSCLVVGSSIHIHAAPPCEWCGYVEDPPKCYFIGAVTPNNDGTHEVRCWWFSECGKTITEECSGGTAYCYKKAVCADCGVEYGALAEHNWSDWTPSGNGTHTRTCMVAECGETETADCSGGTAYCYKKAVCVDCGGEYGDLLLHSFGGWTSTGSDTHTRTCAVAECGETETADCSGGTAYCYQKAVCADCGVEYGALAEHNWSDWTPAGNGTHTRTCMVAECGKTETADCSGGKATCTKQAECEACGAAYGEAAGGHDYEAEVTAPTCTAEGYTLYTCRECGYSFKDNETDMLLHWFGRWTPNADGTHSAVCLRDGYTGTSACFPLEVTAGESLVTVCPVCGESSAGTFEVIEGAFAKGLALPLGEFIVRGAAQPFDGALYAFTAAFEYSGEVQPFIRPLPVSLPVALTEEFTLVRVDVTPAAQGAERTEAWTEVPFTLENGTLTFEAENTALYLLLPLQNAAE